VSANVPFHLPPKLFFAFKKNLKNAKKNAFD
jgi:hypothetical protein